MASQLILLLLSLTCCSAVGLFAAGGGDVILKPIKSTRAEAALVIVQGDGIEPAVYVALAKEVQVASAPALWVGVPQYGLNLPQPLDVGKGILGVLETMKSEGMQSNATVFVAAHSLSGIVLQGYLKNTPGTVSGQILLGSFMQRQYRNESYPVPTLTVSGELDGFCRVSRVMEEYWHKVTQAKSIKDAASTFPVAVVAGMNHFQFTDGSTAAPLDIKKLDLQSEVSYQEAHQKVATILATFIGVRMGNASDLSLLVSILQETGEFLSPLIAAYEMEGFYQFKPPCLETPPSAACNVGCHWSETATAMIGNLTVGKVNDSDAIHPAAEILPHIHHPHILSSCTKEGPTCVVNVSSVSENIYGELDKLDTGLVATSASEIRAKMKSRQSIMEAAGMGSQDFNKTDAPYFCKLINQQAYIHFLSQSGVRTRQRFATFGVQMVMEDDEGPYNNGGIWIYKPMSYTKGTNATGGEVIEVRSLVLKTPTDYFLKGFAGMHFCKLLSPARVMEWAYVDGLRTYYGSKD